LQSFFLACTELVEVSPLSPPLQQGGQKSLLKSISQSATLDRAIVHTFFDNLEAVGRRLFAVNVQ
jgi:hypothetical protein